MPRRNWPICLAGDCLRKKAGLSVDVLAEELKTRGLLNADADSSTLVEKLKGMRRPTRKTQGEGSFQPLRNG